jgi:hypothetical protein
MMQEIKKNNWPKFCKKFSMDNQCRLVRINVMDKRNLYGGSTKESPFMGLLLEKKGRLIDGLSLYSAWVNPDKLTEPAASLKQPVKVLLEKDADGNDRKLVVYTNDGNTATIEFLGEKNPHYLVEKVAYRIFEGRGMAHGNDMGDWFEAEKKIKEAEKQFV